MTQAFKLARIEGRAITPSTGEDLGEALSRFAFAEEDRFRANPNASVSHWAFGVAQLLYLAADAFDRGAAVSIGHKRSARYEAAASELRRKAEAIEAEGKATHDDIESKRLLKAFDAGYAGEWTSYSFDNREAYLVGKLFAQSNEPKPARINKIYSPRPLGKDSPPDHLLVDGIKFVIVYPEGKTTDAFAKPIA